MCTCVSDAWLRHILLLLAGSLLNLLGCFLVLRWRRVPAQFIIAAMVFPLGIMFGLMITVLPARLGFDVKVNR